ERLAGAVTVCGSEASFRSGSFLALDCKAFVMHGSKALRFGIRLFSASTAFLLWLCCSALRTAPNDLHALPPSLERLAGAVTVCGSEASFRSGSFLALDCKAFSMHGSKALRFGIRLFSASTAFLLWLCCSALRTAPNDLHALSPSLQVRVSRSGDGLAVEANLSAWKLPCAWLQSVLNARIQGTSLRDPLVLSRNGVSAVA